MNPPSDNSGLEFTPPAPPDADVAAASFAGREEGDAPLEEPEGLAPAQKALWDNFSKVCGTIGTAAAIEAFRQGFKAVGIPIPGEHRRPPSQKSGGARPNPGRAACRRPAGELTPAQKIVWEKYEALCSQYGHEVAVNAVRSAFAAVDLPVPDEFEEEGEQDAAVDPPPPPPAGAAGGGGDVRDPVVDKPGVVVAESSSAAGPAITQEGVVLAAPQDLSPQQSVVWTAFVGVAKRIGATPAVNSYTTVFANLGIPLPSVADAKPRGPETLLPQQKKDSNSNSNSNSGTGLRPEGGDLVEPEGLSEVQKKAWDSFVEIAGKLGLGVALNSFRESFEVLGIPLPTKTTARQAHSSNGGGNVQAGHRGEQEEAPLVQTHVPGELVEPEGLNTTQKRIWASFASLVQSIGYERAAANYQHAFKNLKITMPADPNARGASTATTQLQASSSDDANAAPALPAPAFALTEKEEQARILREREPANLSEHQKGLWNEMAKLTESLGVALASASYSFAFKHSKVPMPNVDEVVAAASAALSPGSPGSQGSRSDGAGSHVTLREPAGLNASQKALWSSFANMAVPMMGLASAVQMYQPQLKAFGIPVPSIAGNDSTAKADAAEQPRLETPAGLSPSQLQVWNTFANTVIISVGVKVAVQTYGPAFKTMGIPMPSEEVLVDFEKKLKASANSTARSVYAAAERVRQMQDLGPNEDRGLFEAVTGFDSQLNLLGPEAVHYQISLRRMLAAIVEYDSTPPRLASVLEKADRELREAMVEGRHRLPRLEKQIRRALEAELLEFGTFEVGAGVPTPGGGFVVGNDSGLSSPSTPVITPGTHDEPIPAMACAAFGLLCSGLVEAPAIRNARRHGGSRADLDYCMFAETADEICDPTNGGGSWSKEKGNALLLCAHLSSFLSGPSRERTPLDRFLRIRNICASHMETITHELTGLEKAMRDSGQLGRLAELQAPEDTRRPGRLRQDADDVLGLHPDFEKYREAFKRPPVLKTSSNMKMYVRLPLALLKVFDPDLQAYCRGAMTMYENELLKVQLTEGELSLNFQPYILFLITIGRRVNPYFQQYIHDLVGGPPRYKGNPLRAKIKGFSRMKEKQEDKYTHLDYAMPSCAVMCDVVRCLIECASPEDLEEMFHVICEKMEVVRVKNGFAEEEVPFGFRQILMNVRYTTPDAAEFPGVTMICEVQLNLASYVHVKHKIHKLYSVARCTHNCAHQPDLRQQLMKQAMTF